MFKIWAIAVGSSLACLTIGCTDPAPAPASVVSPAEQTPKTNNEGATSVSKIVFIGQKESCPCTRKRIDEAWPVLNKVLKGSENIAVKKIQNDVDVEEAEKYDDMRTVMVAPGIFFFDKDEKLVDMVQGAVTESQILTVLKK